jgi:hypothetical protein
MKKNFTLFLTVISLAGKAGAFDHLAPDMINHLRPELIP